MKRYYIIAKGIIQSIVVYRVSLFFFGLGTLLYITVSYFLWKSIFGAEPVISGMTFNQTFLYLSLASTMLYMNSTWADQDIARNVRTGAIITDLLRPVSVYSIVLSRSIGVFASRFIFVTIPSVLLVVFVFHLNVPLGINVPFFIVSVMLSFFLNFNIDFIVGTLSFYTQSIWGVSTSSGVIVSLLSGALIPISFFPGWAQGILHLLPFEAIYNIPANMMIKPEASVSGYLYSLLIQVFWAAVLYVLGRFFFSRAVRVLTVNGG